MVIQKQRFFRLNKLMARNTQGILLALLYCIFNAIATTQVSHMQHHFSPLKLIFYNIIIMLVFFSAIILFKRSAPLPTKIPFRYVVFINITSALAWICGVYSLQWIAPAMMIAIGFGLQPLFTCLLQRFFSDPPRPRLQINRFVWIISGLVIVLMAVYADEQLSKPVYGFTLAIGLFLSTISGLGSACSFLYVKRLSHYGASASRILTLRYILLLVLTFIFLQCCSSAGFNASFDELLRAAFITFTYLIIPILCIQKALEYTSLTVISFIVPLQPVLTYGLQMHYLNQSLSHLTSLLLVLLSLAIIIGAWINSHTSLPEDLV